MCHYIMVIKRNIYKCINLAKLMKKTLLTLLCAAATAFNVAAGPKELYSSMMNRPSRVEEYRKDSLGRYTEKRQRIGNKQGIDVNVRAYLYDYNSGEKYPGLCLYLKKNPTNLEIGDYEANGLSRGDYIILTHEFTNGDRLGLDIKYNGKKDYEVRADLAHGTEVLQN